MVISATDWDKSFIYFVICKSDLLIMRPLIAPSAIIIWCDHNEVCESNTFDQDCESRKACFSGSYCWSFGYQSLKVKFKYTSVT